METAPETTTAAEPPAAEPPARGGLLGAPARWMRSLYDWMMAWSARRSALGALFGFSFAESSFFPVPPDPLLMAIVVARPMRWFRTAALCTVASVLGGLLGYAIGVGLMDVLGWRIIHFYHAEETWTTVEEIYRGTWGVWFLLGAAFTPIPYKVATIAAGATEMPVVAFALTSLIGRGARFFLVAGLLRLSGPRLKIQIEKHFNWLSLVFLALLVLGFVAVKFLLPIARGH